MAVQCIQELHPRVFLPYFHTVVNELTTLILSRARVRYQVLGVGNKACGVTDGTRARAVDVLVCRTRAYV